MRQPAGLLFCLIPEKPGTFNDSNARRWDSSGSDHPAHLRLGITGPDVRPPTALTIAPFVTQKVITSYPALFKPASQRQACSSLLPRDKLEAILRTPAAANKSLHSTVRSFLSFSTNPLRRPSRVSRFLNFWEPDMIILGILLIIAGFIIKIAIVWTIGIIVLVIGLILMLLGMAGHGVGGRWHYF